MEDREVLSTRCYICDKAARKRSGGLHQTESIITAFPTAKAWLFKGKDPYPENVCDPESVFVIKTMKLISKEDVDKIIEKGTCQNPETDQEKARQGKEIDFCRRCHGEIYKAGNYELPARITKYKTA